MFKKLFSITSNAYQFEIWDITVWITILNVVLVVCGFWVAPLFGLANCLIIGILNQKNKAHLNQHISNIMLIILNIYFLI